MQNQSAPKGSAQRLLARRLLVLVCLMYAGLLAVLAFFPSVLHKLVFGHSITLGIPVAFIFMVSIFIIMTIYAVPDRRE